MARRKIEDFSVRTIQKTGGNSYMVTLPVNLVRKLKWREGQKVEINKYGEGMIIRDWDPKK